MVWTILTAPFATTHSPLIRTMNVPVRALPSQPSGLEPRSLPEMISPGSGQYPRDFCDKSIKALLRVRAKCIKIRHDLGRDENLRECPIDLIERFDQIPSDRLRTSGGSHFRHGERAKPITRLIRAVDTSDVIFNADHVLDCRISRCSIRETVEEHARDSRLLELPQVASASTSIRVDDRERELRLGATGGQEKGKREGRPRAAH